MSQLDKAREIELPKIYDHRGNLSFAESGRHIPFPIRRVFFIYDIPGGETRGGHAHKKCTQTVSAVTGSFTLRLTDGINERVFRLDRGNKAVLIPTGVWLTMEDFTTGTVCLALASEPYEEEEYFRDFEEFLEYTKENSCDL